MRRIPSEGLFTGAALAAMLWATSAPVPAADLKQETLQQWQEYVKAVDARNRKRLAPGTAFLSSLETPALMARLRNGEIVVSPVGPQVPMKIFSGLIHDWIGAAFLPNARLKEVVPLVRDYSRYKDFYSPNVVESKLIAATDSNDRFSMVLMNKSVVLKTALDSDYLTSFTSVDDHRWYSVSETTRVQEIADYDTPSQHVLPEDHGTGLIWRLHSVTRFEERGGGVYVELEAVALSRDIPGMLRWMIDPIVRRVSQSSLATSLRQTETAVRLHSAPAVVTSANDAACSRAKQCGNRFGSSCRHSLFPLRAAPRRSRRKRVSKSHERVTLA
jgi:hypothetical protein